jgi:hypothetical protein
MKITIKTSGIMTLAFLGAAALVGCSGSSSSADGGDASTNTNTDTNTSDGPVAFGLTPGDSCFDVVSVVGTPDDGCDLGVGDTAAMDGLIGTALPFNYVMDVPNGVYTIAVGTNGILGGGAILNNMATLVHDAAATSTTMATCMWHENSTSMVTVTAVNAFTIAVVRTQSMFTAAPACTASFIPPTGTCTSKWTWTMKKSTTKTTATMCK